MHPIIYWACVYLPMLVLKLNHLKNEKGAALINPTNSLFTRILTRTQQKHNKTVCMINGICLTDLLGCIVKRGGFSYGYLNDPRSNQCLGTEQLTRPLSKPMVTYMCHQTSGWLNWIWSKTSVLSYSEPFPVSPLLNTMSTSFAIRHQGPGSVYAKVMMLSKPLTKPMLNNCQLYPWKQNSENIGIRIQQISFQEIHLKISSAK